MPNKVKYKAGIKKITLLRNLVAKQVYSPTGWSSDETYVVFDLHDRMSEQASADKEFSNKYGLWLNTLGTHLKELNPQKYPFKMKSVEQLAASLKSLLPSKSAFFGWEKNPLKKISFAVTLNFKLPKIKITKPYIGIGYRDKGSAKNKAKDGSPSWQNVASRNTKRDRIIKDQIQNVTDWARPKSRSQKLIDKIS